MQSHGWLNAQTNRRCFLCLLLLILSAGIYFYRIPTDPPGFYIDESSIAYNAHTISQNGRDEYGIAWPLYFRAFGEYKNPTLIYLLALVFRFTGPSIFVARLVCALLGLAAAFLTGVLAWKISRQFHVAMFVWLSAALTPWLFESSRLVFEVAAYPLVLVLFLLALCRASRRTSWRASDVVAITATLALLTYSYSIGRLLAPLLALGLLFFARRENRRRVAATLFAYAMTLLPLIAFALRHPAALNARFSGITYLDANSSLFIKLTRFAIQYAIDINPWTMLFTGEQNPRDHVGGTGALLIPTFVIAVVGLLLIFWKLRSERWWGFIIYALAVSIVPAALTVGQFPQLRLIAVPVFAQVLMVPALSRVKVERFEARGLSFFSMRTASFLLIAAGVLLLAQGIYFQVRFHRDASSRWYFMDSRFDRKTLQPALSADRAPIYLLDPPGQSGYIQALWHGSLRGLESEAFARTGTRETIPSDSVVISTERNCENCRLLARGLNYIVYDTLPSKVTPNISALPGEAFRAQLSLRQTPTRMILGERQVLRVSVKNISTSSWSCISDAEGRHAVIVRARWRKSDRSVVPDAARAELNYDLEPDDVNDVDLEVTPPTATGDYILEIDLVEEPDTWFSQNGSGLLRVAIAVAARE